jgi:ABC-2 type transport system permease protein
MVLLIILLFLAYSITWVYHFSETANGHGPPGAMLGIGTYSVGTAAAAHVFNFMTMFGMIIGIVIGCSAIASDRAGHALNTLLAKPLYRDTIINGKILGSLGFLATYLALVMAVFTAALLVFCGSALAPSLGDYLSRLPFVFVYALVFVGVFLGLGMFVSVLVRDQAVAMILAVLVMFLSEFSYLSDNINYAFPGLGLKSFFEGLSPNTLTIQANLVWLDSSRSAYDAFNTVLPDVEHLFIFIVIALVLSYIVFVRRDIS